jgi:hypothetical protein
LAAALILRVAAAAFVHFGLSSSVYAVVASNIQLTELKIELNGSYL